MAVMKRLFGGVVFLALGLMLADVEPAQAQTPPKSYAKCEACHAYSKGAAAKIGPNLYGIWGRKAGSLDGFAFSRAAREASFRWTETHLRALLRKPKGYRKHLRKALHAWRGPTAKTLEDELIPFFRTLGPAGGGK